ncbi:hypothetical protein H1C71_036381 [Ictidomys tridecemlineatus]|nr:hypothetical protein H1C71_036381 [Ictidomys tridecemlineatus]
MTTRDDVHHACPPCAFFLCPDARNLQQSLSILHLSLACHVPATPMCFQFLGWSKSIPFRNSHVLFPLPETSSPAFLSTWRNTVPCT